MFGNAIAVVQAGADHANVHVAKSIVRSDDLTLLWLFPDVPTMREILSGGVQYHHEYQIYDERNNIRSTYAVCGTADVRLATA